MGHARRSSTASTFQVGASLQWKEELFGNVAAAHWFHIFFQQKSGNTWQFCAIFGPRGFWIAVFSWSSTTTAANNSIFFRSSKEKMPWWLVTWIGILSKHLCLRWVGCRWLAFWCRRVRLWPFWWGRFLGEAITFFLMSHMFSKDPSLQVSARNRQAFQDTWFVATWLWYFRAIYSNWFVKSEIRGHPQLSFSWQQDGVYIAANEKLVRWKLGEREGEVLLKNFKFGRATVSQDGQIFFVNSSKGRLLTVQHGEIQVMREIEDLRFCYCSPRGVLYVVGDTFVPGDGRMGWVQKFVDGNLVPVIDSVNVARPFKFTAYSICVSKNEILYIAGSQYIYDREFILKVDPNSSEPEIVGFAEPDDDCRDDNFHFSGVLTSCIKSLLRVFCAWSRPGVIWRKNKEHVRWLIPICRVQREHQ